MSFVLNLKIQNFAKIWKQNCKFFYVIDILIYVILLKWSTPLIFFQNKSDKWLSSNKSL